MAKEETFLVETRCSGALFPSMTIFKAGAFEGQLRLVLKSYVDTWDASVLEDR